MKAALCAALLALVACAASAQGTPQAVKVSATVQAERDGERQRILAKELESELAALPAATDAAARERTAENIAALRREIARAGSAGTAPAPPVTQPRQRPPASSVSLAYSPAVISRAKGGATSPSTSPQESKQ